MARTMYYTLDAAGEPVPEPDVTKWFAWFERVEGTGARTVGATQVAPGIAVSTIFLSIDHAFGIGSPVLWETLVVGGPLNGRERRYTTRQGAIRGHAEIVALVEGTLAGRQAKARQQAARPEVPGPRAVRLRRKEEGE